MVTVAALTRDELIAQSRARAAELRAGSVSRRRPPKQQAAPLRIAGRIRDAVVVVGTVVLARAFGIPFRAFVPLLVVVGAASVLYLGVPFFIERGLPRLLRGRSAAEVERTQSVVFGIVWLAVFVVAPVVARVFFGVDAPVPPGEIFVFGALILVVWVVGKVAHRRLTASQEKR